MLSCHSFQLPKLATFFMSLVLVFSCFIVLKWYFYFLKLVFGLQVLFSIHAGACGLFETPPLLILNLATHCMKSNTSMEVSLESRKCLWLQLLRPSTFSTFFLPPSCGCLFVVCLLTFKSFKVAKLERLNVCNSYFNPMLLNSNYKPCFSSSLHFFQSGDHK